MNKYAGMLKLYKAVVSCKIFINLLLLVHNPLAHLFILDCGKLVVLCVPIYIDATSFTYIDSIQNTLETLVKGICIQRILTVQQYSHYFISRLYWCYSPFFSMCSFIKLVWWNVTIVFWDSTRTPLRNTQTWK